VEGRWRGGGREGGGEEGRWRGGGREGGKVEEGREEVREGGDMQSSSAA